VHILQHIKDDKMKKRTWLSIPLAVLLSVSLSYAQGNPRPAPRAAAPADTAAVVVAKARAGQPAIYEIQFTPTDTLATDAEIVITFPGAFDLSLLEVAGSTRIDGGLKLAKDKQQVTVRRTGLGSPIAPGKRVSLKLGLIKNPQNLAEPFSVTLQIRPSARRQKTEAKQARIHFTGK